MIHTPLLLFCARHIYSTIILVSPLRIGSFSVAFSVGVNEPTLSMRCGRNLNNSLCESTLSSSATARDRTSRSIVLGPTRVISHHRLEPVFQNVQRKGCRSPFRSLTRGAEQKKVEICGCLLAVVMRGLTSGSTSVAGDNRCTERYHKPPETTGHCG